MANLTGEYDVAVEVSVGAINRVLAVVHENQDRRFPVLPHSLKFLVDDTPRGVGDVVPASDRTGVQGRVEIQISTPTISLPQGGVISDDISVVARIRPGRGPWGFPTPPDVSIRVGMRAWVLGPIQPSLPEFVHGDVIVNANVVRTSFDLELDPDVLAFRRLGGLHRPPSGTFIGLDRGPGLSVTFVPAAGTTVSEEERVRIQQIVTNVLRGDFEPVTFRVDPPEGVERFDFRFDPDHASVALMMLLTKRNLGPGAVDSVSGGLIPVGSDFAIAIGRDYIVPLLRSFVLQNPQPVFPFSKTGVSGSVRPDWGAARFDLETGRIVLTVTGSGKITYGVWPATVTDNFTFTVRVGFTLAVVDGGLEPRPAGDPQVDLDDIAVFEGFIEGKARDRIREERDRLLAEARTQIREALRVQRQLEAVLAGITPSSAGVTLTGAQIRPEGVIVPGRIGLAPSSPVVVRQVKRDGKLDAVDSWIPGGAIDRFIWSAERPVVTPLVARVALMGGTGQRVEEHRFVTEASTSQVAFPLQCLEVQGRRVTAGGAMAMVSAHTCGFSVPLPPFPVVPWPVKAGRAMPVVPLRGILPDGTQGTVGHFSPWASGLAPMDGATTLVVHFASDGWEKTADSLAKALARTHDAAVVVVVLLPEGDLAKAVPVTVKTDAAFIVGEDVDDHWSEGLGVSKLPATVLIDSRGRVAYREDGRFSASKLAEALAQYAQPGGRVSSQVLRLGVVSGDVPPEFAFRVGRGAELSLRRLRGRRVALTFWSSWSEPSLEQLRRLRLAHESSGGTGPTVFAIGDGESADRAAEVAKAEELPFPVIPDPDRAISSRFGVAVWPSTVWIGPAMRVEGVNLGLTGFGGTGSASHPGSIYA